MGKRHRDRWKGEETQCGVERQWQQNRHSCVVNKNWEAYLGRQQSQPQVRLHNPGFQRQEDKSPLLLAVKTSGGWGGKRNCQIFRKLCLKGLHNLKIDVNPPTLGFSTGQQLEGHQSHTGSG